jgi:hypothetical protein
MSGINEQDARALTYLAMRIRQETYGAGPWDEHGTFTNIRKLTGRSLALTAESIISHAADPAAKTPGVLAGPFRGTKPSEREPEKFRPPKADEACPVCGGWCPPGDCVRDRFVADDEERTPRVDRPASTEVRAEAIKTARAAMRGGHDGEEVGA